MFETFARLFDQMQIEGFWHDSEGFPRYESIVKKNLPKQKEVKSSYLFPPLGYDDDQYDTYTFGENDDIEEY